MTKLDNIKTKPFAASADDANVLTLLSEIDISELTAETTDSILKEVLGVITNHLKTSHGYIILKGSEKHPASVVNVHRDGLEDSMVTASYEIIDSVMKNGKTVFLTDTAQSDEFKADPAIQRFNIKSVLCTAIISKGNTWGVIYLDSSTENCHWDQPEKQLTEFLGIHIGLGVANVYLQLASEENLRLVAAGKAILELSHSVKNILQMVGGAAEVIDFGLRSNEIHRVIKSWAILKPNLERLKKFTLDMLDYSKERKLEIDNCDFNRVIQGSIESLQDQLKSKKLKLQIRVDPKAPSVELDSERVHEMSLNLILNAIDIVDQDKGAVTVETKYLTDSSEMVLYVTDNGPGMTDEIRKKIFEPFESGKNKFGTGLGMPIAKQVVDQHSGRIEIQTELGKGTTFEVYLPTKPVQQ